MNNENKNSEFENRPAEVENGASPLANASEQPTLKSAEKKPKINLTKKQMIIGASAIGAFLVILVTVLCIVLLGGKGTNSGTGDDDEPTNSNPDSHVCEWKVDSTIQSQTCTDDGVVNYSCSCGEKKTSVNKANGHRYSEWSVKTAATCAAPGEDVRLCKVCQAEETKITSKLDHDYEVTIGNNETIVACRACDDEFTIASSLVGNSPAIDQTELYDCPSDFSFYIVCEEDEEYIRENLRIFDSFFENTEYEYHENVICDYLLTETQNNVWLVTPVEEYKAGMTYTAIRKAGVIFKDYGLGNLSFSIWREDTNEVAVVDGIKYLSALEKTSPGYYPYELSYSENADVYWLTLEKTNGLSVGDIICVGNAENFEEMMNAKPGDNLFGEILSIEYAKNEGNYLVKLAFPEIDKLFTELDIYQTGVSGQISEESAELLKTEAVSALYESEGFKEFIAASYAAVSDYAKENNVKISADSLKKFFNLIKITPVIPNFEEGSDYDSFAIGVKMNGSVDVDILNDFKDNEVMGKIFIRFDAGITIEYNTTVILKCLWWDFTNENAEAFENNKENIYFHFKIKQTTTTTFNFDVEISGEEEYTGEFKDKILEKVKNGELDEAIEEIRGYTNTLSFSETTPVKKPQNSPLVTVPICTGVQLDIIVDLYVDFKLYAAFSYEYKTVKVDTYGFTVTMAGLENISSSPTPEKTNEIIGLGYVYIEAGAVGKISLRVSVIPPEKLSANLNVKFGVYAEAQGALYWSFVEGNDDNDFLYGRIDIGLKLTIWGDYVCFGLEKITGDKLTLLPEKTFLLESIELNYEGGSDDGDTPGPGGDDNPSTDNPGSGTGNTPGEGSGNGGGSDEDNGYSCPAFEEYDNIVRIDSFVNGLASFLIYENTSVSHWWGQYGSWKGDYYYGFIDGKGNVVVKPQYACGPKSPVPNFEYNYTKVSSFYNDGYIIDRSGNVIFEIGKNNVTGVGNVSQGYFWVETVEEKVSGNVYTVCYYSAIDLSLVATFSGIRAIPDNRTIGNKNSTLSDFGEGELAYDLDKSWWSDDDLLIFYIGDYDKNYVPHQDNWGVDIEQIEDYANVDDYKYHVSKNYNDGCLVATVALKNSDGVWFYSIVDDKGNVLLTPQKNIAFPVTSSADMSKYDFCYGLCPAFDVESGYWGYIDINGNWKIKPQYSDVTPYSVDGRATVERKVVINTRGEVVLSQDGWKNDAETSLAGTSYTFEMNGNSYSVIFSVNGGLTVVERTSYGSFSRSGKYEIIGSRLVVSDFSYFVGPIASSGEYIIRKEGNYLYLNDGKNDYVGVRNGAS